MSFRESNDEKHIKTLKVKKAQLEKKIQLEGEKLKERAKKANMMKIEKEEVSKMKSKIEEMKEELRGKQSTRSKRHRV